MIEKKNKDNKDKLKICLKALYVILGIITVFFFVYWAFRSDKGIWAGPNTTPSDWLGFIGNYLGAIIGAFIAIVGVYLTIKNSNQQQQEFIKYNYIESNEKKRSEAYPLITVNFIVLENSDDNFSYFNNLEDVVQSFSFDNSSRTLFFLNEKVISVESSKDKKIREVIRSIKTSKALKIISYTLEIQNIGLNVIQNICIKIYDDYNCMISSSKYTGKIHLIQQIPFLRSENRFKLNMYFRCPINEAKIILKLECYDIYMNKYSYLYWVSFKNNGASINNHDYRRIDLSYETFGGYKTILSDPNFMNYDIDNINNLNPHIEKCKVETFPYQTFYANTNCGESVHSIINIKKK